MVGPTAIRCLEVDEVQGYLRGDLEDRERVDEHLDACDDCRALVAAAARVDAGETRVSRYVLGELIGAGAMGTVYAAQDPELRRRVAIKLLTTRADARLLREAQALARVSHPNVVPIYDVGTHQGSVFLAMELVDGQDLRRWLAERPRRPREVLDVMMAAGRGLAAAHAAGLVHRDVKPENVLVGADGRVRVTDFGLARDQNEAASSPPDADAGDLLAVDLTAAGHLAGTPAYMAPEQLAGVAADAKGDQFSFCVTLHEALYGERPFGGRSLGELRRAAVEGRVAPEARGARLPPAVRRALLQGLAARVEDRHASMDVLLAKLARGAAPRRGALVAALLLIAVLGALAADLAQRSRAASEARAAFAAAADRAERTLQLRSETFVSLSEVTSVLPVIREIAGNYDKAEFGLGEADADAGRLELLHDMLASADWSMWTRGGESSIAVADYKGRLVYSSAAPRAFGGDLRALPVVARAYETRGPSAMLVAAGDAAARAAGLVDGAGVLFVLAGAAVPGGVPRAVLVEVMDARRLLADLTPDPDTRVALVAGDAIAGRLPEPGWPQLSRQLAGPGGTPLGTLVLGRAAGGGLFPGARVGLASLALVVMVALGAALRRRL